MTSFESSSGFVSQVRLGPLFSELNLNLAPQPFNSRFKFGSANLPLGHLAPNFEFAESTAIIFEASLPISDSAAFISDFPFIPSAILIDQNNLLSQVNNLNLLTSAPQPSGVKIEELPDESTVQCNQINTNRRRKNRRSPVLNINLAEEASISHQSQNNNCSKSSDSSGLTSLVSQILAYNPALATKLLSWWSNQSTVTCLDYDWLTKLAKNEQWNQAWAQIQNWLPKWNPDMRAELYKLLTGLDMDSDYGQAYLSRIERIEQELINLIEQNNQSNSNLTATQSLLGPTSGLSGETILISGAWCFYGSVLLSLTEIDTVKDLDQLFDFTSLYMLFDYWIDDQKISRKEKMAFVGQFCELIENPRCLAENSIFNVLTGRLIRLIKQQPTCHQHLKNAYYSELIAALVQHQADLSTEQYLRLAEWKGGNTVRAIQSIIGVEPDQAGYRLGACFQLVDDIHDLEEDQADGINTIATHIYQQDGCLDRLLFYAIYLISQLAAKHTLFKPCLMSMLMHSVAIVPCFSSSLKQHLADYYPLGQMTNLRSTIHQNFLQKLRGVHKVNQYQPAQPSRRRHRRKKQDRSETK